MPQAFANGSRMCCLNTNNPCSCPLAGDKTHANARQHGNDRTGQDKKSSDTGCKAAAQRDPIPVGVGGEWGPSKQAALRKGVRKSLYAEYKSRALCPNHPSLSQSQTKRKKRNHPVPPSLPSHDGPNQPAKSRPPPSSSTAPNVVPIMSLALNLNNQTSKANAAMPCPLDKSSPKPKTYPPPGPKVRQNASFPPCRAFLRSFSIKKRCAPFYPIQTWPLSFFWLSGYKKSMAVFRQQRNPKPNAQNDAEKMKTTHTWCHEGELWFFWGCKCGVMMEGNQTGKETGNLSTAQPLDNNTPRPASRNTKKRKATTTNTPAMQPNDARDAKKTCNTQKQERKSARR